VLFVCLGCSADALSASGPGACVKRARLGGGGGGQGGGQISRGCGCRTM